MLKLLTILFLTHLMIVSSESGQCRHDSDCGLQFECKNQICLHKSLNSMQPIEYLGSVLIFLMSALANSTGIGGGEIMVPLLILLFFFDTHSAVPLSLAIMLGGNFIKTVLRIPERHHEVDRPIIDYHLVALTLAPLLVGATSGFMINRVLPDWLILFLMTALLFYLTVHIGSRAEKSLTHKKSRKYSRVHEITLPDLHESVLKPIVQPEIFPLRPIAVILSIYTFSMVFVFLRGDKSEASILGITYCSAEFWVMISLRALVLFAISMIGIRMMVRRSQDLNDRNYSFVHDVQWNGKNTGFVVMMSILAGLGIGVMGIGGSAIINPAMVYVGVHHDVARATVGAAVFLTCSVTLIQYMIAGMLVKSYAVWFFVLSLLGASAGSWIITYVARKFDRRHLPLITLAVILGITTLVTPTYVITNIVNGMKTDNFQYGFKNICEAE